MFKDDLAQKARAGVAGAESAGFSVWSEQGIRYRIVHCIQIL